MSYFTHTFDNITRHENVALSYLGDFEHPNSWLATTTAAAAALSVDMDQAIGQGKVGQWSTVRLATGQEALDGALAGNRRGNNRTTAKCRHVCVYLHPSFGSQAAHSGTKTMAPSVGQLLC
jgi:hypothetical protein